MEGGLILHDTQNTIHTMKQNVIILNIDFRQACAKIKWPFVLNYQNMIYFSIKWCDWVV